MKDLKLKYNRLVNQMMRSTSIEPSEDVQVGAIMRVDTSREFDELHEWTNGTRLKSKGQVISHNKINNQLFIQLLLIN